MDHMYITTLVLLKCLLEQPNKQLPTRKENTGYQLVFQFENQHDIHKNNDQVNVLFIFTKETWIKCRKVNSYPVLNWSGDTK